MSSDDLKEIRSEGPDKEWMDPETAAAWRKWHDKSVRYWQELSEALFDVAQLAPGQRVLDLASGTGDPALAIAAKRPQWIRGGDHGYCAADDGHCA